MLELRFHVELAFATVLLAPREGFHYTSHPP